MIIKVDMRLPDASLFPCVVLIRLIASA